MKRKVVITGMGCINSLGNNVSEVWGAFEKNKIGIEKLPQFDESSYHCQFGGVIKGFSSKNLDISGKNMMNSTNLLEIVAVMQACEESKIDSIPENIDSALFLGNNMINLDFETMSVIKKICHTDGSLDFSLLGKNIKKIPPLSGVKLLPTVPSHFLAKMYDIHGEGNLLYSGDTSGTLSIIQSAREIESGLVDRCIVATSFSPFQPNEFSWLCKQQFIKRTSQNDNPENLSTPFYSDHNGVIYGEGAAALVLETEETAMREGKKILGYINGGSFNIYSGSNFSSLSAEGFKRNIVNTLTQSNSSTSEVDVIYAHGTSHKDWDEAELKAIDELWGNETVNISSSKRNIGYTSCSSGVMDCIMAVQTLLNNKYISPIKSNEMSIYPELEISSKFIRSDDSPIKKCLINSAGLGGGYASIIVEKGDIS
ncbi:beta-ketoacyl synthase [Paenibacillus polysaccharolyticus]|uniref:beta-ketoacyl-[acyl-carrier-protein] synthase family protein n=1 Tax=Paenibacillus polysaccharolyticus TaxID=582692 RepID=UPI0020418688|nr:beta-ketoacyl synthase [Paenibacillus polysaccharolyticus]MCM3135796.1 beta-ketoacyl synthase [Paenibacillus polysaccharolyticus]